MEEIFEEEKIEDIDFDRPHVMSPITNWIPKPMQTIKEFLFGID